MRNLLYRFLYNTGLVNIQSVYDHDTDIAMDILYREIDENTHNELIEESMRHYGHIWKELAKK